MKAGALFRIIPITALVLFPTHFVLADPPALEEIYQKRPKSTTDSLTAKKLWKMWKGRINPRPYSQGRYNMPIAEPDSKIVYYMFIAKPDPNILYNMPGAQAPRENPRFHLQKYFALPDTFTFSLPDSLKSRPTYLSFPNR